MVNNAKLQQLRNTFTTITWQRPNSACAERDTCTVRMQHYQTFTTNTNAPRKFLYFNTRPFSQHQQQIQQQQQLLEQRQQQQLYEQRQQQKQLHEQKQSLQQSTTEENSQTLFNLKESELRPEECKQQPVPTAANYLLSFAALLLKIAHFPIAVASVPIYALVFPIGCAVGYIGSLFASDKGSRSREQHIATIVYRCVLLIPYAMVHMFVYYETVYVANVISGAWASNYLLRERWLTFKREASALGERINEQHTQAIKILSTENLALTNSLREEQVVTLPTVDVHQSEKTVEESKELHTSNKVLAQERDEHSKD